MFFWAKNTVSAHIECVDINPQFIGYSEKACNLNPQKCTFLNGSCWKKASENFRYCNEFSVDECNKTTREGCKKDQNQCLPINPIEYSQIGCNQVANQIGCLNITTKQQFCQYNEQDKNCQFINLDDAQGFCNSFSSINSQVFCEKTIDIPCKYNSLEHKCENAQGKIEFQCIRGLNQIACLTLTQYSDYIEDFFKKGYHNKIKIYSYELINQLNQNFQSTQVFSIIYII